MKALAILQAGMRAQIVHARTALQDLGWAVELRDRSLGHRPHVPATHRNSPAVERCAMRKLALSFRRDLALVQEILECEREIVCRFADR